jgi:signal transduction histidine kinase
VQAIHGPGRIVVKTPPRGARIEVVVRDTGPGMTPAMMERISQALLHHQGAGHGLLGLAIVRNIVHATAVRSTRESGGRRRQVRHRPAPRRGGPGLSGERILVIEDEKLIRMTLRSACSARATRLRKQAQEKRA